MALLVNHFSNFFFSVLYSLSCKSKYSHWVYSLIDLILCVIIFILSIILNTMDPGIITKNTKFEIIESEEIET